MGHHHHRYNRNSSVTHLIVWVGEGNTKIIFFYGNLMLEPMEEDILQVVKYCTDLIDDKDLEKLDLIIKYMKR